MALHGSPNCLCSKASCAKFTGGLEGAYAKRFSAAFQLMTSQMALKYSALRFWYWRLDWVVHVSHGSVCKPIDHPGQVKTY